MHIVNVTKDERVLLNACRLIMLNNDPNIEKLYYKDVIVEALKHYIGDKNRRRKNN